MTSLCDDSRLCQELAGDLNNSAFRDIYEGQPPSRVLTSSPHFSLLVDIAPLTEGHLLLLPRDHLINFGLCPRDAALSDELTSFRDWCVNLLAGVYGPSILLEHGSSPSMAPSACVAHAHWHLVPTDSRSVPLIFERDGLKRTPLADWTDLLSIAEAEKPYIYYRDSESEFACDHLLSKRHQYLRVVLAEVFGIAEPLWDWSLCVRKELLRDTVSRLAKAISAKGDFPWPT